MRKWTRAEAVAIALVFMAASLTIAFHNDRKGAPVFGDFPSPAGSAPAVAAPHNTSTHIVQATFEQPAGSPRTTTRTASQPRTPASHPTPGGSQPPGVWTFCQPDHGALACKGITGTFKCTTSATTGDTTCKGRNLSISCTTDPQTGARECETPTESWQCMTNPDTQRTGCAGSKASYSCAPTANAAEGCTGLHASFDCYDFADGRSCETSTTPAPDCFFEPIFGAFCRW